MEVDSTLPGGAIKVEFPRSGEGNVLRLEEAYQGRAMFVKVKCLVGDAPTELAHHPELRLRFPPRPGDGAPLIANGVSIQARDDVEVTLKRDRAGCYVTLDELVLFEGVGFEILCEKERWATGRVTRRDAGEGRSRDSDEPWSLELNPAGSALGSSAAHWGVSAAGAKDRDAASPGAAEEAFLDPVAASLSSALGGGAHDRGCQLGLELCLVGTCDGRHTCMTRQSALPTWKVTSPKSFIQLPSLDAIVELHDWPETGSDEDGSGESLGDVDEMDRRDGPAPCASNAAIDDADLAEGGDPVSSIPRAAPWSLVPWKGEMSLFDRAELLRNVRKRYEDLMHEYHSTNTDKHAANDLFTGELTWFSAGIRIGVGLGLGVCLGLGLGVGVLVNGYKVSRDRMSNMRQALGLGYRR